MLIYVNSVDSVNAHFSNSSVSFAVNINPPLQLQDKEEWVCALMECDFGPDYKEELYIYCDLIEPSIVKGRWRNVLRVVTGSGIYPQPYYNPIVRTYIDQIRFRLTTYDDTKLETKPDNTRLVLELTKNLKH